MKRRLLCLLLVPAVLLGLMSPIPASALDSAPARFSGSVQNPLYPDLAAPPSSSRAEELPGGVLFGIRRSPDYLSPREAADVLRQAMVDRLDQVTLYIKVTDLWYAGETENWFVTDFFPMAYSMEIAQGPYDGDYLKWSWRHYDWALTSRTEEGCVFSLALQYFTSSGEEAALASAVTGLSRDLGLSDLTPAEAYESIYDYITSNVVYAGDAYWRVQTGAQQEEDYRIFTAYGALLEGTAVCQGYAALYYALCREADLPVRMVTSLTHAWNIVYLKHIWYETDCTWDAETESRRDWFLTGSERFESSRSHISEAEFRKEPFLSLFPISPWDYDPDTPFNDVPKTGVHYDNIRRAAAMGLFNGTGFSRFDPARTVDRAMAVTVLWRLAGCPNAPERGGFTDVPGDAYYAGAVAWAREAGITGGVGGGLFDPHGPATREQIICLLYRYAGAPAPGDTALLGAYRDGSQVSPWAAEAMVWAAEAGILRGTAAGTLSPAEPAAREQLASLLVRLIDCDY